MIKLLIWLAGCCALLVAIDRMELWRELSAIGVVIATVCWVFGGALVFGAGLRGARPRGAPRGADAAGLRATAEFHAQKQREVEAGK